MTDAILAIDAGTSSIKALLVELDSGVILARASAPLGLHTPRPGWVEQDATELLDAVDRATREVQQQRSDVTVSGIALSNQRESVVAWDARSGRALGPLLSWQDARMADYVDQFDDDVRRLVRQRTGLTLDAMFSAPKMKWLLEQSGAGDIRLGTVDSWLIQHLTGTWSIEAGNASRTLLLDLATGDWDEELLGVFDIPRRVLPDVVSSNADFGVTRGVIGIPDGIPVLAVLADSHAALYAQSADAPGMAKATYGTGTSVMIALPSLASAEPGIDTTIAWWTDHATYAREGNILATGQAIDWAAHLLAHGDNRPGGVVVAELAAAVEDSGGVSFVPAFTGLSAPHWDRSATALISGMSASTLPHHVARAALESVAHQVADLIDAMTADGHVRVDRLHADGGASSSALLMQIQADLLGRPVAPARESALSPLGAAYLAAARLGVAMPPVERSAAAAPAMSAEERLRARAAWSAAVARARYTPAHLRPESGPTHPEENA